MGDMQNGKIQSFRDLLVWQKGHIIVLKIYELTKNFPKDELFALVSQLRRAAVSITSNIAEGFGRQFAKEKVQFYCIAYGSLLEIQNQIEIAKDLKYIGAEDFKELDLKINELAKMIQGLIRSIRVNS